MSVGPSLPVLVPEREPAAAENAGSFQSVRELALELALTTD